MNAQHPLQPFTATQSEHLPPLGCARSRALAETIETFQTEHRAQIAALQRQIDELRRLVDAGGPGRTRRRRRVDVWLELSVGERLRRLIQDRGLSHSELARESGLSRTTLGRVLDDQRPIKRDELARLAAVLEVDPVRLRPDLAARD